MSTSHPVDSSHITQGAGIPDDALNAMIGATVPTEGGTDCDDALSGMCRCVRESGHAGNHRCLCAVENLSGASATMPSMTNTTTSFDTTATDTPLIRRLRFAEDVLMALNAQLLREASGTPIADNRRLDTLEEAAKQLRRAADEVRDVRHDVTELGQLGEAVAR